MLSTLKCTRDCDCDCDFVSATSQAGFRLDGFGVRTKGNIGIDVQRLLAWFLCSYAKKASRHYFLLVFEHDDWS